MDVNGVNHRVLKDLAAGSAGGALALFSGYPMDTIKVQMQTAGAGKEAARTPLQVAAGIMAKEGMRGFFKGLAMPLGTMAAFNATVFGVRGAVEDVINPGARREFTVLEQVACGAVAGAAAAVVVCPVELVKCRLQTTALAIPPMVLYWNALFPVPPVVAAQAAAAAGKGRGGPTQLVREVLSTQGARGMYRGFAPTLVREIVGMGCKFGGYELAKKGMLRATGAERSKDLPVPALMLAGGASGVAYWGSVYPVDVLKSLVQADDPSNPKYRGAADAARQVLARDGARGLYRGFGVAMLRSVPVTAVNFTVFEFSSRWLADK